MTGSDPDGDTLSFSITDQVAIDQDGNRETPWSPWGTPPFTIESDAGLIRKNISYDPGAWRLEYESEWQSYEITVSASDGEASATAAITINVNDVDEAPIFGSATGFAWEGSGVSFLFEASAPEDFVVTSYQVDLDRDGTFDWSASHNSEVGGVLAWNAALLHVLGDPAEDGSYTATLRISTSGNEYRDFSFTVSVGDTPPAVNVSGPESVDPGTPYTLSVSTSDPGPDTVSSIQINWGDGNTETHSGDYTDWSGSFDHVYAATGVYTVRVTATDEQTSNVVEWIVNIGDTNAPDPVITDPFIDYGWAEVLQDGSASLTVQAYGADGSSIVSYDWDLDGDGVFELSGGPTVLLQPGFDAYPFMAWVRVTDAAGRVSEAFFGFAGAGAVEPQATLGNYRKLFLEATPDAAGTSWQVHHTIQVGRVVGPNGTTEQVLANRYLKERGINVHDKQYLRAVHPDVHKEITRRQANWWTMKAKEMGLGNDTITAMRRINLAEYDDFVQKLDVEYRQWWRPGQESGRQHCEDHQSHQCIGRPLELCCREGNADAESRLQSNCRHRPLHALLGQRPCCTEHRPARPDATRQVGVIRQQVR